MRLLTQLPRHWERSNTHRYASPTFRRNHLLLTSAPPGEYVHSTSCKTIRWRQWSPQNTPRITQTASRRRTVMILSTLSGQQILQGARILCIDWQVMGKAHRDFQKAKALEESQCLEDSRTIVETRVRRGWKAPMAILCRIEVWLFHLRSGSQRTGLA